MSEFAIGDKVRLSPTSPNIRLHNQVGDAVGIVVKESTFKAWVVSWPYRQAGHSTGTADVHEHELEMADD